MNFQLFILSMIWNYQLKADYIAQSMLSFFSAWLLRLLHWANPDSSFSGREYEQLSFWGWIPNDLLKSNVFCQQLQIIWGVHMYACVYLNLYMFVVVVRHLKAFPFSGSRRCSKGIWITFEFKHLLQGCWI